MSFYTSLTGLNAATAELGIVSNNIANVGTIGFKKSRAEFGDIFATSPLQNASSSIGQGVLLKGVSQEFSQGNVASSQNSLDMAIQGQGFFVLKPNLTSNQTVYTRNGSFRVNNDRYVVDSSGQFVQVFPVNDDGSVVATGLTSAKSLQLPTTSGLPKASSQIDLGVNLPADAEIIPQRAQYASGSAVYRFDRNDPNTFNRSTSITVFDSLGNPSIATIYYVKLSNATTEDPTNKWQTYIYVGDREIKPALLSAKTDKGESLYIDKFGQQTTNPALLDPTFNASAAHALYYLNDQKTNVASTPAKFTGGFMDKDIGFDFGSTDGNKISIGASSISTNYSGNFTKVAQSSAAEKYEIDITAAAGNVHLDLLSQGSGSSGSKSLSAAEIDEYLAKDSTQTLLSGKGVGITGSAQDGTLSFYAIPDATTKMVSPFSIKVTNTCTAEEGGFTSSQFNSATDVPVGAAFDSTGNLTDPVEKQLGLDNRSLFKISVDDSDPISVSLPDSLRGASLTGTELAAELTKAINNAFGDDVNFNIDATNNKFKIYARVDTASLAAGSPLTKEKADLLAAGVDITIPVLENGQYSVNASRSDQDLVLAIQKQINEAVGSGVIKVGYDSKARSLTFKPYSNENRIQTLAVTGPKDDASGNTVQNTTLGFPSATNFTEVGAGISQGLLQTGELLPQGNPRTNVDQRRYGMKVEYLKDQRKFVFSSGTTGESSMISLKPGDNLRAANILGFSADYATEVSSQVGSGLPSKSAVTIGSKAGIDISSTFSVTNNDNVVNVTVDGVDGTVKLPPGPYTGETFASALEARINAISSPSGKGINGVKVTYDADNSRFVFTSGTTSEDSFININGHPNFGLNTTTNTRGTVPKVTVLVQAKDADGNLLYIDKDGNETTKKPENLPNYSPIYLTKGQLTFDTAGKLVSPKEGAKYTPFDPQNGADLITLNVDYGKFSTQYSQPFSVLSLSQDGYASGRLDGINIDTAGVVRANYTNGQQQALGKIILANFASPNGLKQIGNANYVATSSSGSPSVGEAGSDGFGSIQGGALERANVDLTEELVQLITAQRNFQANAKAIETATNLTSTIVNIRG